MKLLAANDDVDLQQIVDDRVQAGKPGDRDKTTNLRIAGPLKPDSAYFPALRLTGSTIFRLKALSKRRGSRRHTVRAM